MLVLLIAGALPAVGGTSRPLDMLSVALRAGAFGLLVLGGELLAARPALAVMMFTAAALSMAGLVWREAPKAAPLMPLDLLRGASFRMSVIASVCCFAGQTAGMVALPFHLQNLAQAPLMTGLYLLAWPLSVALAAPLASRLASCVATAWLCAAGCVCLTSGLGAAAVLPLTGEPLILVPLMILCGLGFGLFNVANNRQMFLSVAEQRSGAAGGMQATARLCGQTIGALVISLLYSSTSAGSAPQMGLGIGAVFTLLAALASMLRAATR